jgi:CubicO group peptidase (beta-lactamase class C family)
MTTLSEAGLTRIDAALQAAIDEGEIPGASILIAHRGRIVHRADMGLKDMAAQEPLAEDTIFRIFSMTKPVTAVAMMILYEEGMWRPEDPVAKHLPDLAALKGPGGADLDHAPTLLEILTHTAGFGYGIGPGPHDATDKALIAAGIWQAESLADFVERVARVPLATQPGDAWRYSLSMDLQGAMIERLTGESLPDVMRKRIFAPLGMIDTDFYVPPEKRARLAKLYHKYGVPDLTELTHPGFVRDPAAIPKLPSGGGGLFSTTADYGRFAQMLLKGGELEGRRILSPDSVALMRANHLPSRIVDAGVDAGFQKIGPGRGYGFNGAVFFDPKAAGAPVGQGTYQWDGAGGTWFWIDPENDLLFVGMIQRMLQDGMPPFQALTQDLVAKALI